MTCYYALHGVVLEIVALILLNVLYCTVLYCIVLYCVVLFLFVCSVSLYDNFHVRLSYDRIMDLRNDLCMYVCMWAEFLPRYTTVNSEYYKGLFERLRNDVRINRPKKWANGFILS